MLSSLLPEPPHSDVLRLRPAKKKVAAPKEEPVLYTAACNKDSYVEPLADPSILRSNYDASVYSTYQRGTSQFNGPATGMGAMGRSGMQDSGYHPTSGNLSNRGSNYAPPPPVHSALDHNSTHGDHYHSDSHHPTALKAANTSAYLDNVPAQRSLNSSRPVVTRDCIDKSPYAPPLSTQMSPESAKCVPRSFVHPGHGESTYLLDYIPPNNGGIADTIIYSRKVTPGTLDSSNRVDGSTGHRSSPSTYSQNYIAVRIDGKDYLAHLTPFDGANTNNLRNTLPTIELAEDGTCIEVNNNTKNIKEKPGKTTKDKRAKTPKGKSAKDTRK